MAESSQNYEIGSFFLTQEIILGDGVTGIVQNVLEHTRRVICIGQQTCLLFARGHLISALACYKGMWALQGHSIHCHAQISYYTIHLLPCRRFFQLDWLLGWSVTQFVPVWSVILKAGLKWYLRQFPGVFQLVRHRERGKRCLSSARVSVHHLTHDL